MNITSLEHAKARIRRDLQDKSGRCSRAKKGSREPVKGNGSGESATKSLSFRQVLILGLATFSLHSDKQQRVPDTPGSGIWTCRFKVIRMPPSEYVRIPSGVRKANTRVGPKVIIIAFVF